jgi:hypothetical protein
MPFIISDALSDGLGSSKIPVQRGMLHSRDLFSLPSHTTAARMKKNENETAAGTR